MKTIVRTLETLLIAGWMLGSSSFADQIPEPEKHNMEGLVMSIFDANYKEMKAETYSTLLDGCVNQFQPKNNLVTLFTTREVKTGEYAVAVGAGLILDSYGHILTASHVAGETSVHALFIAPDNRIYVKDVVVEVRSENSDLAIARLTDIDSELNWVKTPSIAQDVARPGDLLTGYCLEYMHPDETNSVRIFEFDDKDSTSPTRGLTFDAQISTNVSFNPRYTKICTMSSSGTVLNDNFAVSPPHIYYRKIPSSLKATHGNSGYPVFGTNGMLYGSVSVASPTQNLAGFTNPDALRFIIEQHKAYRKK